MAAIAILLHHWKAREISKTRRPCPTVEGAAHMGPLLLIHRIRLARSGCFKVGSRASKASSGVGGRVLRRFYFNFVDHLLHVRNLLGQFFSFNLLLWRLYGA